jgi:hypothetical protein
MFLSPEIIHVDVDGQYRTKLSGLTDFKISTVAFLEVAKGPNKLSSASTKEAD